eukprot:TRINITY_DN1413_c0_g1_i1.p1 TRINITY_DN1413_c0_g1~~TRINITY_DN1413_c0_g1_i1.p1  ORF type:complete len:446 (-),score=195.25 TRINITY_DN1413_c0_g1_i1:153-1490(-)
MSEAKERESFNLVGYQNFHRHNPKTDRFTAYKFHHLEFYCGDAQNTAARFGWALGMRMVAKSDQSTGNHHYASYVMQSHDTIFVFTAPYAVAIDKTNSKPPHPKFDSETAHKFFADHGLGGRAVGFLVEDAKAAYEYSVANGAIGVCEPHTIGEGEETIQIAEVKCYGDAVFRYYSRHGYNGVFFPGYVAVDSPPFSYGLKRIDHVVGNVPNLVEAVTYICKFTGFHEFAEFTADDVGTVDSGLNSMVLANNNEMILMPLNEPTYGTRRKSQIQTYLEQNLGAGVQHIALKTDDIFSTLREMKQRKWLGGFEFVPKPVETYYTRLRQRIGDELTAEQYAQIEELGILVDKDDQGILLQIFTRPVGDRPTLFFEIIQRFGCADRPAAETEMLPGNERLELEVGGCGGFGKGNFAELFKSIEDYERLLDGTARLNERGEIELINNEQ